jgi:hypothetical protein
MPNPQENLQNYISPLEAINFLNRLYEDSSNDKSSFFVVYSSDGKTLMSINLEYSEGLPRFSITLGNQVKNTTTEVKFDGLEKLIKPLIKTDCYCILEGVYS